MSWRWCLVVMEQSVCGGGVEGGREGGRLGGLRGAAEVGPAQVSCGCLVNMEQSLCVCVWVGGILLCHSLLRR